MSASVLTLSKRATLALAGGGAAVLLSACGAMSPMNFGLPATWEAMDGSKLTATQLAVAPSNPASLPLQLVKANPAMGGRRYAGRDLHSTRGLGGWHRAGLSLQPSQQGRQANREVPSRLYFWKAA